MYDIIDQYDKTIFDLIYIFGTRKQNTKITPLKIRIIILGRYEIRFTILKVLNNINIILILYISVEYACNIYIFITNQLH
jgi:hypothetical protein